MFGADNVVPHRLAVFHLYNGTGLGRATLVDLVSDGLFGCDVVLCLHSVTHRLKSRGTVFDSVFDLGDDIVGGSTHVACLVQRWMIFSGYG
jgi:hypothetical protein